MCPKSEGNIYDLLCRFSLILSVIGNVVFIAFQICLLVIGNVVFIKYKMYVMVVIFIIIY